MSWVVGVDVGGTFTDFCLFNRATNEVVVHKVPSTPENLSRAVLCIWRHSTAQLETLA